MLKLNLGCGGNVLDGFLNIGFEDGRPDSDNYLNHDLSKSIPATFESVDVMYNCHFLEHLTYQEGIGFLRNSHVVMKEGAIMRILVPDLELWCMKSNKNADKFYRKIGFQEVEAYIFQLKI